jgi:hypothetical protein
MPALSAPTYAPRLEQRLHHIARCGVANVWVDERAHVATVQDGHVAWAHRRAPDRLLARPELIVENAPQTLHAALLHTCLVGHACVQVPALPAQHSFRKNPNPEAVWASLSPPGWGLKQD